MVRFRVVAKTPPAQGRVSILGRQRASRDPVYVTMHEVVVRPLASIRPHFYTAASIALTRSHSSLVR